MFKKNKEIVCDHRWVDVSTTFNPPLAITSFKQNGANDALMLKTLYGVTNIVQRCSKCSKLTTIQTSGKANT